MAKSKQSRPDAEHAKASGGNSYARRHLRIGWWGLLGFLSLGILLEVLHGFKVGFYLDVDNHTRRLMWTLAHAHGVLLSLVNIALGLTLYVRGSELIPKIKAVSYCLLGALLLLPGGFFLGGIKVYGGDPSPLVLLVPVGAAMLFVGVLLTAVRQ